LWLKLLLMKFPCLDNPVKGVSIERSEHMPKEMTRQYQLDPPDISPRLRQIRVEEKVARPQVSEGLRRAPRKRCLLKLRSIAKEPVECEPHQYSDRTQIVNQLDEVAILPM